MDFLKKIDFKSIPVLKIFGLGVLGIIFISVAIWFVGFAFRTAFLGNTTTSPQRAYDESYSAQYKGMPYDDRGYGESDTSLSMRNIMPIIPGSGGTVGGDAEDFEVTEYSGSIKTRNLERTCDILENLKAHNYVIFEDSRRSDHSCYYSFKVENEKANEVLSVLESLKPENLSSNTHTIKNMVDDYTSEVEILQKKLESLEKTLSDAQDAYDELSVLATQTRDVESLAKIIDSKIRLIERLTTERIRIKEQIDRLNRSKAEQLDRLKYTFFSVSVYEILIIDLKAIKNSWIAESKQFIREFNDIIQDVTVNLAGYILRLIQISIYLLIALLIAKYGWRLVRRIWKH